MSDFFKEEKKIKVRIEKAAKRLKCMEDIKDRIGKLIDKYVQETTEIENRIMGTEELIESLLAAQTQAASKRKIREEIQQIKAEKKVAEADLLKLKRELCCKIKKLQKVQKQTPKIIDKKNDI